MKQMLITCHQATEEERVCQLRPDLMTRPDHLTAFRPKGLTPSLSHSPCQDHLGAEELNAPAKPPPGDFLDVSGYIVT
ncbi:hypothetical protein KOW79_021183 [Hemibagrus wyckioides]|uniref:Uncharacterized protein n=1 Tax=Hemibagrus wyckioides TaxID=337641 RepID=A0A9D3S995_9TELE|nr:hypothetical protein KOW79_021183 [Hemibagrus wyckioides]